MKSMEQFGKPLVSYEGAATIGLLHQGGELTIEGYFEAAQFLSGRVAVSVVPINTSRPQKFTLGGDQEGGIAFSGRDSEGWSLNPRGETFFALTSWLIGSVQPRPREQTFSAEYLEAKRSNSPEHGYNEATFLITNFLWDDRYRRVPEEIQLAFGGLGITVTPLESYLEIAQRLRRSSGAEPTAQVLIRLPGDQQKPLREFEEIVEDLLYVFRLVTGNLVNWCYGEAVDRSGEANRKDPQVRYFFQLLGCHEIYSFADGACEPGHQVRPARFGVGLPPRFWTEANQRRATRLDQPVRQRV